MPSGDPELSDPELSGPRAERPLEREIMDGPLPYGEARRALRDLDRVNRWTLGAGGLLRCLLRKLGRVGTGGAVHVLDVGSGTGYGARRLVRAAGRRGIPVRAVCLDRRLVHLVVGRELHPGPEIRHRVVASADALPFRDGTFHWTTSHLLFHHFGGADNRRIVQEMRRCAAGGVAIVDLRPSPVAALLIRALFPLLGIGQVAREDGLLSVRQAWSVEDVRSLARDHRWPVDELRSRFPFRWSLVLEAERMEN